MHQGSEAFAVEAVQHADIVSSLRALNDTCHCFRLYRWQRSGTTPATCGRRGRLTLRAYFDRGQTQVRTIGHHQAGEVQTLDAGRAIPSQSRLSGPINLDHQQGRFSLGRLTSSRSLRSCRRHDGHGSAGPDARPHAGRERHQ